MSSAGWRSRVHGLVADRGRVLLERTAGGWALPCVELDGDAENDLRLAVLSLEKALATRAAVLRYVDRTVHRDRRVLELVYVLECPTHDDPTPDTAWVDLNGLAELPLAEPAHRSLLERHVGETRESIPAERAPWAHEGWLEEAREWIELALTARGRPPTGRVEQVRVWCLSCLLRIPTPDGAVFFKATAESPLFADEGRVMSGLARLFPGRIPDPLAVEAERRWMLLEDHGPELGWDAPVEVRELVHRLFAGIQVESTGHIDELLAMGCLDRSPRRLALQIGELVSDDDALSELDDGEIARLRALEPRLVALCHELAAPVPSALVHGDLHLSNVARNDGRYVFYDWTDACVSHPFFDLIDVFREKDDAVGARIRDAYLSAWLDFEPMDRLLAIWRDAEIAALLHHAVSYRSLLANVEPGAGRELEWALPHFLRRLLGAKPEDR